MAEKEIVQKITEKTSYAEGEVKREKRIEFHIPSDRITEFLRKLKNNNFESLMQITVVDWLKDEKFELVYQIWSHTHKIHAFTKVEIPREENPEISTVKDIFPVAETYERDAHDFYGIKFDGNEKIEMPWILDGPEMDKHPHRKDFNMLEYAKKKYKNLDRYDENKNNYVI